MIQLVAQIGQTRKHACLWFMNSCTLCIDKPVLSTGVVVSFSVCITSHIRSLLDNTVLRSNMLCRFDKQAIALVSGPCIHI